jgi:hypothetical protein
MTAFAALVGSVGVRAQYHPRTQRVMMTVAAVLAIAVGGVWLIAPLA